MKKYTGLLLLLFCSPSWSANHFNCNGNGWAYWNINPIFQINNGDFTTAMRNEIVDAGAEFNAIGNVARQMAFGVTNAPAAGNNQSEIWNANLAAGVYASNRIYFATSCLGGTSIIQEMDIRIDMTNTIGIAPYDPNSATLYPMKNIALHELGHAMGLAHNTVTFSVMKDGVGAGADMGDIRRQMYHSDDKEGFRSIYGNGTTELNVAAGQWWVEPGEPNGTIFRFNLMTDFNGFELPSGAQNDANEDINIGTGYRLPYSIENHSTSTQDVRARFYASTDNNITTGDTLLGSVLYTMGKATEISQSHWFSLPSTLAGGGTRHWFGYIVDKPYNSSPDGINGDDEITYNNTHRVF